jgi:hypothetical protein
LRNIQSFHTNAANLLTTYGGHPITTLGQENNELKKITENPKDNTS